MKLLECKAELANAQQTNSSLMKSTEELYSTCSKLEEVRCFKCESHIDTTTLGAYEISEDCQSTGGGTICASEQ